MVYKRLGSLNVAASRFRRVMADAAAASAARSIGSARPTIAP